MTGRSGWWAEPAPEQIDIERRPLRRAILARGDSRSEAVTVASPVLAAASKSRERIYAALLGNPEGAWTVSQLTDQLPKVPVEAIRTTIYLLLAAGLMEQVPHTRALTVRLTDAGRTKITEIRSRWAAQVPSNGGA